MPVVTYPMPDGTVRTVDSDSLDFQQRAAWVARQIGASGHQTVAMPIGTLADPLKLGARGLTYFLGLDTSQGWSIAPGAFPCDSLDVLDRPKTCVVCAITGLGLAIDIAKVPDFVDPDTEPENALKDWEVPGAVVGPPLAAKPGFFSFRHTGQPVGATVRGAASGRTYTLESISFGPFSFHAWRVV